MDDNKLSLPLCLFSDREDSRLLTIYNTLKKFDYCSVSKINQYKELEEISTNIVFIPASDNIAETINVYFRVQNRFQQYMPIILISLASNYSLRQLEELMYMPLSYTGIQDVIPYTEFVDPNNKMGIIKTIIRAFYRGNYINSLIKSAEKNGKY